MIRHRFHSICPYFAMFPEDFVRKHVLAYSNPGDYVFDPFSGRGTTVLESLLQSRVGIGLDVNPVAYCLSKAKSSPPNLRQVLRRLRQLESEEIPSFRADEFDDEFFQLCFSRKTLSSLIYLRSRLNWRSSQADCFIAAMVLGCLQDNPNRSAHCFSNQMPRAISTKREYSIRWWKKRDLVPPERDVFEILRDMSYFRFESPLPQGRGFAAFGDARNSGDILYRFGNSIKLAITSPPYLDITHFGEDQWLRRWFLGGPAAPTRQATDDRHTSPAKYWSFLAESWAGMRTLLTDDAVVVIRIGAKAMSRAELFYGLLQTLEIGFGRDVSPLGGGVTTAIPGSQIRSFRPGSKGAMTEHDFIFRLA